MKKLTVHIFAAASLLLSTGLRAQTNSNAPEGQQPFVCGTTSPGAAWDKWFNEKVEERKASRAPMATYTIPVIIHVIYGSEAIGTYPNLSLAQLQSQIQVLNDDFAGKGTGSSPVPTIWKNLVANSGISFCYAKTDPKGNILPVEGVDRVSWKTLGVVNPTSIVDTGSDNTNFTTYINTLKAKTIWDPARYLNIWVTDKPSNSLLLGFATFPAGSTLSGIDGVTGTGGPNNDGLWCWGKCFGTTGTLDANYTKGRVSNHEIGHYLGLRHIWGDANCGDDFCNDTPPAKDKNFGCPSYPANTGRCSGNTSGEMTMNMMDYTNDPCKYMFTPDQVTRMQTAMANGIYRKYLGTHGKCSTAPQQPEADFIANKTYGCPGTTIKFTDESIDLPTSWSWTFTGGNPATSTVQNPTVTYANPGVYEVTLVATNAVGNDTKTRTSFINIAEPTATIPLTEGFEATAFPPNTNWSVNNIDYDEIFWQRTTAAGGFGKSASSMVFDNYDLDPGGKRDEINLPKLDLTNYKAPQLTFDVAYVRTDDVYTDTIAVLVSKDCGLTFNTVYVKGGKTLATVPTDQGTPKFVPTSSQWRTETIDLAAYAGQGNVMVVFQNRGHYAQPVYIDNINITATITTAVDAINSAYELALAPNPTTGRVDLNFKTAGTTDVKIEINNLLGQTIAKEFIKNSSGTIQQSFDLSNQNAGVYFVTITYGNNRVMRKLIKE